MKILTSLDLGLKMEEGRKKDLHLKLAHFPPMARVVLYIDFYLSIYLCMYLSIYLSIFLTESRAHSVTQAGSNLECFYLSPLSVGITGSDY